LSLKSLPSADAALEKYDVCGAIDLSSSSSTGHRTDAEPDTARADQKPRKRKADESSGCKRKRDRPDINEDRPGSKEDRSGSNEDRPDINEERSGSNEDRSGSNEDRPGSNEDRSGSNEDRSGSYVDLSGSNDDRPSSKEDRPASNDDRPGSNRDRPGSNRDRRGSNDQTQRTKTLLSAKARSKRKNIKDVLEERGLKAETRAAKVDEENRRARMLLKQNQLLKEVLRTSYDERKDHPVAQIDLTLEEDKNTDILSIASSDSDECRVVSVEEDESVAEDPNNSGLHVNDALNVRAADGRVLVNLGHPGVDDDVYLADQLAATIKPHQIGGIRFLYDNVIESTARFQSSPGFGCILAHNMGLGKTMQIISFVDVFLENTSAKKVLCIVPINTLHNWISEFNYWLPAKGKYSKISEKCNPVKCRNFPIHVLNDTLKNLGQRAAVIRSWTAGGGVLLMGYELYRQLNSRKRRRRRGKRAPECVDIEQEHSDKLILDEIEMSLVDPGPDLVICDEGHRIKNSHASISQALKRIKTRRRIVLTGYPLQNNLLEYWCMVDFVRPNFLGNQTEFCNMFERPIQNGQCIDSTPKDVRLMKHRAHVLHEQLKGFVQRRGHIVLKASLPAKHEHILFVRLTDTQRRLYKRFMEELISDRCVPNPLKAFAVCCKIWNHPDVLYNFLKKKEDVDLEFDPEEFEVEVRPAGFGIALNQDGKKDEINYDWAQGMMKGYVADEVSNSNKLQIFLGILEETVLCGDRLLLFSQSLSTLSLIEAFLHRRTVPNTQCAWRAGLDYFRLDGSTSATDREKLINAFNTNQSVKLFLVSTRAGSLGINLVGANRVVIFDASWNPCHDTQAVCRVYRYGQEKKTHIYRLVTDNSLEKKIYDRQINKQGMADRIVDELNPDAHLSSKEVHSLICDEAEDPPPFNMAPGDNTALDPVMKLILNQFGTLLTKAPVSHESLLVDRKDNKLSKAEKKLAERAYKLEKKSKITYSRPSYAAFYPKEGTFATNLHNPGSNGFTRNRYYDNGKKLESWASPFAANSSAQSVSRVEPDQAKPGSLNHPPLPFVVRDSAEPPRSSLIVNSAFPTPSFSNVMSSPCKPPLLGSEWLQKPSSAAAAGYSSGSEGSIITQHTSAAAFSQQQYNSGSESSFSSSRAPTAAVAPQPSSPFNSNPAMEALSKQGVGIQQITVPRDLIIPTNSSEPPICLKTGQSVMVIKTPKGVYLRMEEKIIKIKQQVAVNGLFGSLGCDITAGARLEESDESDTVHTNL